MRGGLEPRRNVTELLPATVVTLAALFLYIFTLAPGLTWSNFGADGGELIAAAVTNGNPHPPGYPLYILLLQAWLTMGQFLLPSANLAWLGNLLSALCAALSAGTTVCVMNHLLRRAELFADSSAERPARLNLCWIWAALVGLAWATAPLLWEQAIITEVYALHSLLISFLGWILLSKSERPAWLLLPIALGVAHHLTFVLLLPGVVYWQWSLLRRSSPHHWLRDLAFASRWVVIGVVLGALFYIRIPLAARGAPPINWGYPDNWEGFWWLTSASAYRAYLFGVPVTSVFDRVASWAYQLTSQYTALGLALALLGLSYWDREGPRLRNWSLLWFVPVSLYAISYYTRDSTIYMLPCIWLLSLWLGVGLWSGVEWISAEPVRSDERLNELAYPLLWRLHRAPLLLWPALVALLLSLLIGLRLPHRSLRHDWEAIQYLREISNQLREPAIVISANDAETFALWYGVWGSKELRIGASEPVLINISLMQFPWYQRLIRERYSHLHDVDKPLADMLQANTDTHQIFLTEEGLIDPEATLVQQGPLWRIEITE